MLQIQIIISIRITPSSSAIIPYTDIVTHDKTLW